MLKFYEFKTNGIKKRKRLKKLKKNDLAIDRKKKEIQKKMNVFVNGGSGLREFNNVFEKKHMTQEVKLTPEWILDKFSISRYADGEGNIIFYADEYSLPWIELALKTLAVDYIKDEIKVGCNNEVVFSFELLLAAIKNECPLLYQEMYDLNAKEGIER